MSYGMSARFDVPFDEMVGRVRQALAAQGFGVLTEIDVRATLRDKLGEEVADHLILGACHPPLAHRALQADPRIGLLLPCNVTVRRADDETVVDAVNPQTLVDLSDQPGLQAVADEATRRLSAVLRSLQVDTDG